MKINRKQFLKRGVVYGVTLTILHGGIFLYCYAINQSMGSLTWLFTEPWGTIYQFLLNKRLLPTDGGNLLTAWIQFWLNSAFWGFIVGFALAYVATRFIQAKPSSDSDTSPSSNPDLYT